MRFHRARSFPSPRLLAGLASLALLTLAGVGAASAGGATTVSIADPVLQMKAYTVRIPAGWKFQGTVFPGGPCGGTPYPVYRAYSGDGLTELRMLPRFDWTFNTLSPGRAAQNGCLPLDRTLTAAEFLRSLTRVLGASYVGTMPVAPLVAHRTAAALVQLRQMGASIAGYSVSGDVAAIRVRSKNGTFVVEQRLRAFVFCKKTPFMRGSTISGCSARVDVLRAPKGKLDALARRVDAADMNTAGADRAWQLRDAQLLAAIGNAKLAAQERQNNAVMQAQQARFEQSMAVQQHNHDQFLAQMQASTDSSMQAAGAAMNARSTATSDWVDYALDQQTVSGSGGTAKVSSSYAHTWSNGQGQWYQTNDPNANPNGVLGGNWSQARVVHGDGS